MFKLFDPMNKMLLTFIEKKITISQLKTNHGVQKKQI